MSMIIPQPRFNLQQEVCVHGRWTGVIVELQFRKTYEIAGWHYRVRHPHGPYAYVSEAELSSTEDGVKND